MLIIMGCVLLPSSPPPTPTEEPPGETPAPSPTPVFVGPVGESTNLALGKPVSSSHALPGEPASNAVDGTDAQWNSGGHPSQWIEIDLGVHAVIEAIRLTVGQLPDGETVHQILGRGPGEELRLLFEFREFTTEGQDLEYLPSPPLEGIQFIHVVTTEGPSWVAWHEIEVVGMLME